MTPYEIEDSCNALMKYLQSTGSESYYFYNLACDIFALPSNEEKLTALRKLLEAKDCALRACL